MTKVFYLNSLSAEIWLVYVDVDALIVDGEPSLSL